MRVLVTGGTGYFGEHVVRALRTAGHEVRALVRDPVRARTVLGDGVDLLPGDLGRLEPWVAALGETEALVHLGSTVLSWSRDRSVFDAINVDAGLDLTARAREAEVARIVVAGSLFALGPSPAGETATESRVGGERPPLAMANDYVRSKRLLCEGLWSRQADGDPVILVHPTILLGPGQRTQGNHTATVMYDLARGRLPGFIGNGEQIWNLVPVAAAARGLVEVLEQGRPGGNYILGGENWSQRRFVERAAHHLGVPAPARTIPRGVLLALAGVAEGIAAITRRAPALTTGAVRLYDANWSFSSAKAAQELGYAPGDLEATVAGTAAWIRGLRAGGD